MFVKKLLSHIKIKFADLAVNINNKHDQVILEFKKDDLLEVETRILQSQEYIPIVLFMKQIKILMKLLKQQSTY